MYLRTISSFYYIFCRHAMHKVSIFAVKLIMMRNFSAMRAHVRILRGKGEVHCARLSRARHCDAGMMGVCELTCDAG